MKEQKGINRVNEEAKNGADFVKTKASDKVKALQTQSETLKEEVIERKNLLEIMKTALIKDQKDVNLQVNSALAKELEELKLACAKAEGEHATVNKESEETEGKVRALQMQLQIQVKANLDSINAYCVRNVENIFLECHKLTKSAIQKVVLGGHNNMLPQLFLCAVSHPNKNCMLLELS